MEINHKFEFVDGAFDTEKGELICIQKWKYNEVKLCFKAGMNIPFATIKLHSRDAFGDAVKMGEEIVNRWNDAKQPKDLKKALDGLTDEQRMDLFSDYCKYCGTPDPNCQCWNDE